MCVIFAVYSNQGRRRGRFACGRFAGASLRWLAHPNVDLFQSTNESNEQSRSLDWQARPSTVAPPYMTVYFPPHWLSEAEEACKRHALLFSLFNSSVILKAVLFCSESAPGTLFRLLGSAALVSAWVFCVGILYIVVVSGENKLQKTSWVGVFFESPGWRVRH